MSFKIKSLLFYEPKNDKDGNEIYTNFYPLKNGIIIQGEKWLNTEAYYQAMKFRGESQRHLDYSNLIKEADTPMKTKMLGHQKKHHYGGKWMVNKKTNTNLIHTMIDNYRDLKPRANWDVIRIYVMIIAVYAKFTQYPTLYEQITKLPDNIYLVEHTKRDKIWADGGDGGDGTIGLNYLGKILTALSFILKHGSCARMNPVLKEKIIIDLDSLKKSFIIK